MSEITKAVIPAAGLGTRFLPVTKAIAKKKCHAKNQLSVEMS